ncbi:MAG TPA: helix-turn-helix transcriptional regulator [Nonomuraea sp.]|nr:helix-turn-helix transcriptional regulator [Nonomuraea sp.]
MDSDNRLGEFLRARREPARPETHGMPAAGRRRTPGMRREEVAMLAGVSTDYYIRLEQGRDKHPSAQVLEALANALTLEEDAVAHSGARQGSSCPRSKYAASSGSIGGTSYGMPPSRSDIVAM